MRFPEGQTRIELEGQPVWWFWRCLHWTALALVAAVLAAGFYSRTWSPWSFAGLMSGLFFVFVLLTTGLFNVPVRVAVTEKSLLRRDRAMMVVLYFNPPTPFGDVIRVSLGWYPLPRAMDAVTWLEAMIEERRRNTPACQPSPEGMRLAEPGAEAQAGQVAALRDDDLDYLADKLSRESPLREVVLQERQKRWYG